MEASPDQVDVLYSVKERPTGALLLGVGFSSVEKIALSASIRQANAFGTGKYVAANVNSGRVNQVYALSYNDPYFTVDGVSQGFDLYKRRTNASSLSVGPYITDAIGGGVKFGYPVSEISTVDVGLNLESVRLTTFDNSPQAYINFANSFGNEYRYGALTAGWQRDTRELTDHVRFFIGHRCAAENRERVTAVARLDVLYRFCCSVQPRAFLSCHRLDFQFRSTLIRLFRALC